MSIVKLKKFSSRYTYLWGDNRKGSGSASWVPYGHALLADPPEIDVNSSIVGAVLENSQADQPYSGLVLRQMFHYQPGLAENSPMLWRWGLIEPTENLSRTVTKPIDLNTRKIVVSGLLEQTFQTRLQAVHALEGVLLFLESSE